MTLTSIACLVLLTLATGQQQTTTNKQDVKRDNQQPATGVPTSRVENPPKPAIHRAEQQQRTTGITPKEQSHVLTFGDWLGLATLVITGAFLFFTILTWKEMVRANNHAEKAHQEGARETEESLRLTREGQENTLRAIQVSKQQLETLASVARAWLSIDRVMRVDDIEHMPIRVTVDIRNTGFSPALKVIAGHLCAFGKTPPTELPSSILDKLIPGTANLGAGNTMQLAIKMLHLTEDEIGMANKREAFVFVFGRIDYMDISGTSRYTTFCIRYNADSRKWEASGSYNEQT